jgi:hypothetical protein
MNFFSPKTVPSSLFWITATAFLIVSFIGLLATTGGYSLFLFLIYLFPIYLLAWILFTIATLSAKRLRYSQILLYAVLFIFPLTILLNIADGGYYGIGCKTKNFIQYFFDRSTGCTRLWVKPDTYWIILAIYAFLLIIFAIDVLRRRFGAPKLP